MTHPRLRPCGRCASKAANWSDGPICRTCLAFATLLLELIDHRANMNTAINADARWLFPGRPAGQPLNVATMLQRLRDYGFPTQAARTSALRQLCSKLPARSSPSPLGFHHKTTTRVATEAGKTWTATPLATNRPPLDTLGYLENAWVTRPRLRVAAYVIRHRAIPELLVFDHLGLPQAGTQIPAGGVHPGEELEQAVVREVVEETGLLTASVVRQIIVEDKPHPDTRQPRRTAYFHLQTPATTTDAWHHTVHGDGDDAGLTFACRFLPLPLEQPLADTQDAWLGHIDPRWRTPTGNHQ